MTAAAYGYRPQPGMLDTIEGCDRARAEVRASRMLCNTQVGTRSPAEQGAFVEEMTRLRLLETEITKIRAAMHDAADASRDFFPRAFMREAKRVLSPEQFRDICAAATEKVEAYKALPTRTAGIALEPRAGGGGVRSRS